MAANFRALQLKAAEDSMTHLATHDVLLDTGSSIPGMLAFPTDPTTLGGIGGAEGMPMRDPVLTLLECHCKGIERKQTLRLRDKCSRVEESFDVVDLFPTGNGFVRVPVVRSQARNPSGGSWR